MKKYIDRSASQPASQPLRTTVHLRQKKQTVTQRPSFSYNPFVVNYFLLHFRVAVQSVWELEMRHVRPQQGQQQIRDTRDNISTNFSPSSSEEDELPGPANTAQAPDIKETTCRHNMGKSASL